MAIVAVEGGGGHAANRADDVGGCRTGKTIAQDVEYLAATCWATWYFLSTHSDTGDGGEDYLREVLSPAVLGWVPTTGYSRNDS